MRRMHRVSRAENSRDRLAAIHDRTARLIALEQQMSADHHRIHIGESKAAVSIGWRPTIGSPRTLKLVLIINGHPVRR